MNHISHEFRDFPFAIIIIIYNIRTYIYTDIVYFMLPYIYIYFYHNYIFKFGDKQRSLLHLDFEIFLQVKVVGCAWHSDLSSFIELRVP